MIYVKFQLKSSKIQIRIRKKNGELIMQVQLLLIMTLLICYKLGKHQKGLSGKQYLQFSE